MVPFLLFLYKGPLHAVPQVFGLVFVEWQVGPQKQARKVKFLLIEDGHFLILCPIIEYRSLEQLF